MIFKSRQFGVISIIDARFTTSATAIFRVRFLWFIFYTVKQKIFNVLLSALFAVAFDRWLDWNVNFRIKGFLNKTSFFLLFKYFLYFL